MIKERHEIELTIKSIIAEQLSIKPQEISADATFDSLGADSLDRVEIIMKIEEQCGVILDDKVVDTLKTVQDAIEYVYSLQTKK
jgi:acyl carrier protein